jgi:hypothetical protein
VNSPSSQLVSGNWSGHFAVLLALRPQHGDETSGLAGPRRLVRRLQQFLPAVDATQGLSAMMPMSSLVPGFERCQEKQTSENVVPSEPETAPHGSLNSVGEVKPTLPMLAPRDITDTSSLNASRCHLPSYSDWQPGTGLRRPSYLGLSATGHGHGQCAYSRISVGWAPPHFLTFICREVLTLRQKD